MEEINSFYDGKSIAITGGTGSLGTALSHYLIENTGLERLVIISRRWQDQKRLRRELNNDSRLRFFIGDVREKDRMVKALKGVNAVFHCAAIKDVTFGQYNPEEVIRTNIIGSMNVLDASVECGVKRVLAISSDKACQPQNLYGASKASLEHMTTNWEAYSAGKTIFATARYGNVWGSSGSVVPLFREQTKNGELTITHPAATRFWITMDNAVKFVSRCMAEMSGREIFVPKLRSSYIVDLAKAIAPDAEIKRIGLRPGEKIHEVMISEDELRSTRDIDWCYVITPPNYQENYPVRHLALEEDYSSFNVPKYTIAELKEMARQY